MIDVLRCLSIQLFDHYSLCIEEKQEKKGIVIKFVFLNAFRAKIKTFYR